MLSFKAIPPNRAFTLAELLVSIGVIGLIVSITLPNVHNAVSQQKRLNIFKEILSNLNELVLQGSNANVGEQDSIVYIPSRLNAVACSGAIGVTGITDPANDAGCKLQNGALIYHLNGVNGTVESIMIDWNGNEAPNANGQDRLGVIVNWGIEPSTDFLGVPMTTTIGLPELRPGEMRPIIGGWDHNFQTMYRDVYK
jgi:prepilin-type N-terminal cleavage/methylation domain-containing protein